MTPTPAKTERRKEFEPYSRYPTSTPKLSELLLSLNPSVALVDFKAFPNPMPTRGLNIHRLLSER